MRSPRRRLTARSEKHDTRPQSEPPRDIPEWLEQVRLSVEREAPIMQVFMMRAINAVLRLSDLSEKSVKNATAAPTDLVVLMRALSSGELIEDLTAVEPLAPAFIRGIQAKQRLIEEHGGAVTAEQAANTLGVTRQAVEMSRRAGKLVALSTGRQGYRYPVWQFSESRVLPGLVEVLAVLAHHDEWMQAAFFVSRNVELGNRTPIDMLKSGRLEEVLSAAEAYGEHGAA